MSSTNARVTLRPLTRDDAPFILELLNDPDFLTNIGNRNVRTLDDAARYLAAGPIEMYGRLGYGLWCVELCTTNTPIGICGILKRDWLEDVDIGFALLPEFRGKGYAIEAARITLARARYVYQVSRVVAIVSPGNARSERLLHKLGMAFEKMVRSAPGAPEIQLFA